MQDILVISLCLGLGMACGARLRSRAFCMRLADRLSLLAVYGLLFILGVRLGSDAVLLRALPLLGARALGVSFGSTAGSVVCLLLARRFFPFPPSSGRGEKGAAGPSPFMGSLRILASFALGILLAVLSLSPAFLADSALAAYALYLLVFLVGVSLGADLRAFRVVRDLNVKILAVPLLIVAGSGLGALAASLFLPGLSGRDALCVGFGLGYYSLSSILIENAGHSALASTALLANILREVMTILGAPLLVRFCGGLSTVGAAGATAMDTTLPIIARFSGEYAAVIAVFSGMSLTLLVPFLVTAALQW